MSFTDEKDTALGCRIVISNCYFKEGEIVSFGHYPTQIMNSEYMNKIQEKTELKRIDFSYASYNIKDYRKIENILEQNPVFTDGKEYYVKRKIKNSEAEKVSFSNGETYKQKETVWIKITPIEWIYDIEMKSLISKEILFTGIPYFFKNANQEISMQKFLDEIFLEELLVDLTTIEILEEEKKKIPHKKVVIEENTPAEKEKQNEEVLDDCEIDKKQDEDNRAKGKKTSQSYEELNAKIQDCIEKIQIIQEKELNDFDVWHQTKCEIREKQEEKSSKKTKGAQRIQESKEKLQLCIEKIQTLLEETDAKNKTQSWNNAETKQSRENVPIEEKQRIIRMLDEMERQQSIQRMKTMQKYDQKQQEIKQEKEKKRLKRWRGW